jgi:hypothetical protein
MFDLEGSSMTVKVPTRRKEEEMYTKRQESKDRG